ncbi:MAG: glycosyltransferase family 4 protein [Actinomycetota bacterium]
MRVTIDARPAVSAGMTGVGVYTRELILRLPPIDPSTRYEAWYLNARRAIRPWRWNRLSFPSLPNLSEKWTPFPAKQFERLSLRYELPRLEWFTEFDVVFAPNFVPPPTRSRHLVLTIHDLAFRKFPETAPLATRRWLQRLDRALKQAAEVIVPSEATRRDLLELYPVEAERVTVIHHGVDRERIKPASEEEVEKVRGRHGVEGRYLLFLGGLEPRKNLPRLVRAYARSGVDAALVIAGAAVSWNPEGRDELEVALADVPDDVRRRVILTGYLGTRQKAALLTGAEALVFPTLYEGFGFPLLEAMACGTPVLTSNVSSLPEVAGGAALLVDPLDEEAIAQGIGRLISDAPFRQRLIEAGNRRVELFSWDESARKHAEVLHRAARVS